MVDIEYIVVLYDRDGLKEEYYYSTEFYAREHFELFRDGEDADLYSRIDLVSYDFPHHEEVTLDTIEF